MGYGPAAEAVRRKVVVPQLMVSINGVGRARSKHHRGTTMGPLCRNRRVLNNRACVLSRHGKIVREAKVNKRNRRR